MSEFAPSPQQAAAIRAIVEWYSKCSDCLGMPEVEKQLSLNTPSVRLD